MNTPAPQSNAHHAEAVVNTSDTDGDLGAILLRHGLAADRELIASCHSLADEQLDRAFAMGLTTLRETIVHNLGALRSWSDIFAGRPDRPWLGEEGPFSVDELAAFAEAFHADWLDIASRLPLGGVVTRERDGKTYRFTRAQIIAHVTTHSVHHRAQALNMLRQLEVATDDAPLPTGSVMNWVRSFPGAVT